MAASITISEKTVFGNKRVHFGTGNLGSSYTADGEAVTASDFGLQKLGGVIVTSSYDPANDIGCPIAFDSANSKLVALYDNAVAAAAALADAANEDLSGQIFFWIAWGN